MSKLFFDDYPIVIDRELATLIGLNEAIVLQQMHYWLEINKKANKNFKNGFHWTYNSMVKWHKNFPFWSLKTVKRIISILEKDGYIITDNFNQLGMDRTKWYRINYIKILDLQTFK